MRQNLFGIKLPDFIIKILNYEFWSFWIFYFPVCYYPLYLAWKSKSLGYFTATNPGMKYGGAFGDSKNDILKKIDSQYLPLSIFVNKGTHFDQVLKKIEENKLPFPFIAKPNIGERGTGVEKLDDKNDLRNYLSENDYDIIFQEYIDYKIELGVLYYRMPDDSKSEITSIVRKGFLKVEGDGKTSILQQLQNNIRANGRLDYFKKKLGEGIHKIPLKGQSMELEPIGNHCRGTTFHNGNNLINEKLLSVFDKLAKNIEGIYYGRFDLRVKSIEDLYEGKNIKIMELNGTNSESAHIYDPDYNLFQAYKDVLRHMNIIYDISQMNKKNGAKFDSIRVLLPALRQHLKGEKMTVKST